MLLSSGQRRICAITWMTYAGYYFCRKNLSIALPGMHPAGGGASLELANIVFSYSLLYAIGQFGWGFLADRSGAKRVVGTGLVLVVVSNLLMTAQSSMVWLVVLASLNGVGQATGWSGLVKIMASWFRGGNRGIVMAWWGSNYVLGGFLATAFATWATTQHLLWPALGWRRAFLFPALVLLPITVWFWWGVEDAPSSTIHGIEATEQRTQTRREKASRVVRTQHGGMSLRLLREPSLWILGSSYFFLEMCRYALMFWLPLYLVSMFRYSLQVSGYLSSLYELVGFSGALLAGYISDRFHRSRRAPVSVCMLIGLSIILLLQPSLAHLGLSGVAVAISLAGVLSYGPDTLLSGAAAQDIGEVDAAATASGLIDGIGHLGAIVSPYLVVLSSRHFGWDGLFYILSASAFAAALVLLPIWKLEPRDRRLAMSDERMAVESAAL